MAAPNASEMLCKSKIFVVTLQLLNCAFLLFFFLGGRRRFRSDTWRIEISVGSPTLVRAALQNF